jgi:hypothetical protein
MDHSSSVTAVPLRQWWIDSNRLCQSLRTGTVEPAVSDPERRCTVLSAGLESDGIRCVNLEMV